MSATFYNAKPDKSGCGCGFSFNSDPENRGIYASFVRQSDWNAGKKTGVFNGDKLNLKFSVGEAGGIINAIENFETFSAYHDTSKGNYADAYTTRITFGPFGPKDADGNVIPASARYGFSVVKKEGGVETKFSAALSKGDAIVVREYLKFALEHINTKDYSDEKKRRIEGSKNPKPKAKVEEEESPF